MAYQLPLLKPEGRWVAPAELPTLRGAKRISYDVETCDPDLDTLGPGVRRGGYIVGMAVGVEHGPRWYLPMRHDGGGNLDPDLVERWAKSELNSFTGEVVGAHLGYDLDFSAEVGIDFASASGFYDVQIAEPLLDADRQEFNLDALAKDYLGEGKAEEELREYAIAYGCAKTRKMIKQNLWKFPAAACGLYGEADADRPLRIRELQLPRLEAEGLLPIFAVESELMPLLVAMRRRGVRVDLRQAGIVRKALVTRRDAALTQFRRLLGCPKAELYAPDSFAAALVDRGLPVGRTPKSGQYSITKDWLKAHAADEAIATLLEGRRLETTINTFIDGHVFKHARNGRIHGNFNQLKGDDGGTIARLSSDNPNLQNLPARDPELGPMTRSIFIPEDDEDWERDDYSQIEYRLLAHYARGRGSNEIRDRYRTNPKTDFHKVCGEFLGADAGDEFVRKRVKNTNFCKVYGGGIGKIARTFGCSEEEAQRFVDKYDRELPFVNDTYEYAERRGRANGFVTTVGGRRMRFNEWVPVRSRNQRPLPRELALKEYGPRIERFKTYRALNFGLQGGAADIMKKGMTDAARSGAFKIIGVPLVTVHDELGQSIARTKIADEAAREVRRCMENTYELRVPMIVDHSRGESWGKCK